MKCISGNRYGRHFFISMDKGEDVLLGFRKLIKDNGIKNGVLVSAIGTLDNFVAHYVSTTTYPAVDIFFRLENTPLELGSMQGVIADGVPHFHLVVSHAEKTYAGHLEEGCRVLYVFEAAILEVEGIELTRTPNEHGINKLGSK